jgi:hypothetical protein
MANSGEGGDSGMLSDRDKELLFQEINNAGHNVEVKQIGNG